jgi:cyclophilin family peptidyl-prolyl cis-trans isomerase
MAPMKRRLPVLTISATLLVGAILAGCGGSDTPAASSGTVSVTLNRVYGAPPAMAINPKKTYTATIVTSKGTMIARLDPVEAPKTVNNFVFLSRNKFYDGLTFHRVVKDFVIQGGDPEGNGRGGPGYRFDDELPKSPYKVGDLAMANSGPDTNGSQFFVITGDAGAALTGNYARFGHVIGGLEVAKTIEGLADPDAPPGDVAAQTPRETVTITSITIGEA